MADGKISVDLDKLYKERTANGESNGKGKTKPKSIDELRAIDQEDRLLENMMGRGKMSMPEYLMWKDMRMREQTSTQNPIDIEAIIEKATAPFKEQIAEMKRDQERREQDAKLEGLRGEISDIKNMILNGTGKKNDEDSPLMKKLEMLETQLKDEKEKAARKQQEQFEKGLQDRLDYLDDRLSQIGQSGSKKSESEIEQLINARKRTKELLDALGVKTDNKDDEASTLDVISTGVDAFNEKAPALMKTFSSLRDGIKGGTEITDDIPMMDIPTSIPGRSKPNGNKSTVPDDIMDFLNAGHDSDQGFVDVSGVPWQDDVTGKPIMRKDIEIQGILHPENVRLLMEEAYQSVPQTPSKPKPRSPELTKNEESETLKDDIPASPAIPDAEQNTITKEEETIDSNPLKEAMDYIASGEEKEDEQGNIAWVGNRKETYESDNGFMNKEQMIAEARADPKVFMQVVRDHLKTLDE